MLQHFYVDSFIRRLSFFQQGIEIINVVAICQKNCRFEHSCSFHRKEKFLSSYQQLFNYFYYFSPSHAQITEKTKNEQPTFNLHLIARILEKRTLSKFCRQLCENIWICRKMKLSHILQSQTVKSNASVNSIDIRFNQLTNCIFWNVLIVHVKNIFPPSFKLFSTYIKLSLFTLQQG